MIKDYKTGKPRGFGFVLFEDKETVEKVLAHEVNGGKVEPKKCEKKEGKMFVEGIKSSTEDDAANAHSKNEVCYNFCYTFFLYFVFVNIKKKKVFSYNFCFKTSSFFF